jgi:hypothetical protein
VEALTLIISGVVAVLGLALFVGAIALMIRLWDTLGQASEYFARENERYRCEYERHHRTA